jgi:hypothetical protein
MQNKYLFFTIVVTFFLTSNAKPFEVPNLLTGVLALNDSAFPKFSQYPAPLDTQPRCHKIDFKSNPIARQYRTTLKDGLEGDPNYCGHYSIVRWGCGSSCAMFAVIDNNNGKVITAECVSGISNLANDKGYFRMGFHFCRESRLLIIVGIINEMIDDYNNAYFYVLENNKLKLIYEINNFTGSPTTDSHMCEFKDNF